MAFLFLRSPTVIRTTGWLLRFPYARVFRYVQNVPGFEIKKKKKEGHIKRGIRFGSIYEAEVCEGHP